MAGHQNIDEEIYDFWHEFSDDLRLELTLLSHRRRFFDNDIIYVTEEEYPGISFVFNGSIRCSINTPNGDDVFFYTLQKGQSYGEATVFNNSPRRFDAVSIGRSEILELTKTDVLRLFMHYPEFALKVTANLSQIIDLAISTIMRRINRPLPSRICDIILREITINGPILKLTQQDISDRARCSRLRAHRFLKKLADQGAIELAYGQITVADQRLLRDISILTEKH